jgi:ankyrin repeat protein
MKPIFEAIHKCSEAIEKGKAKDVQKYLEQIQALIKKDKTVLDLVDNDSKEPLKGDCPIHRASRLSRGQIVDVLLGLGDNVNRIKSTNGATPLHLATANNDLAMVSLLLNSGAKVNAVTSNSLESTP